MYCGVLYEVAENETSIIECVISKEVERIEEVLIDMANDYLSDYGIVAIWSKSKQHDMKKGVYSKIGMTGSIGWDFYIDISNVEEV